MTCQCYIQPMVRNFVVLLTLLVPAFAAPATFTVDDLLHVANASIADVSDDGRYLAMTVATLEDRIGIDNHRFGDPTYIAPSKMDLYVIDTTTGARQKVFPERTQVTGAKWSPNGSRLAMFVVRGDAPRAAIWERESGKLAWLSPSGGGSPDPSAEFIWSRDGARVMVGTSFGLARGRPRAIPRRDECSGDFPFEQRTVLSLDRCPAAFAAALGAGLLRGQPRSV